MSDKTIAELEKQIAELQENAHSLALQGNELITTQTQMQSLIHQASDGIIQFDKDGKVTSFNRAAEKIFDYSEIELLYQDASALFPRPDEYQDNLIDWFIHVSDTTEDYFEKPLIGLSRQGKKIKLELSVSLIENDRLTLFDDFSSDEDTTEKELISCLCILRDITHRIEIDKELMQARDQALAASKSKTEFLSSMSHELRTPLNAILGFSQILEMNEDLDEEDQDNLKQISSAGSRLLSLINQILELAKIEQGKFEFDIESISVDELINICLSQLQPLAEMKNISLHYNENENLYISSDYKRLKQSLTNLITNAILYNHDNGSVTITVEENTQNNHLRFNVIDNGPGIEEDKFDDLFEPFNRLEARVGNIPGSGIGLTITKKIIENLNGEIGVTSKLNEGSNFWFELPQEEPE